MQPEPFVDLHGLLAAHHGHLAAAHEPANVGADHSRRAHFEGRLDFYHGEIDFAKFFSALPARRPFFLRWASPIRIAHEYDASRLAPKHQALFEPSRALWEMYDLERDPEERRNLAGDPARRGSAQTYYMP